MAVASGEVIERLDDAIVRQAESTAAQVADAKAAIGNVIFGQERVLEQALMTVLSGGHALLVGRALLFETFQVGRQLGDLRIKMLRAEPCLFEQLSLPICAG